MALIGDKISTNKSLKVYLIFIVSAAGKVLWGIYIPSPLAPSHTLQASLFFTAISFLTHLAVDVVLSYGQKDTRILATCFNETPRIAAILNSSNLISRLLLHHVITWPYVIFKPVFLVCSLLWNVLCVVRETRHSCCKIEQKCPEVIEESALAVLQKLVQLNFTVGINMTGVSTAAWVSAIVGTSKGAPQEAEVVNVTGAIVIQVAVADQVVTVGDATDTITTHLRAIR